MADCTVNVIKPVLICVHIFIFLVGIKLRISHIRTYKTKIYVSSNQDDFFYFMSIVAWLGIPNSGRKTQRRVLY